MLALDQVSFLTGCPSPNLQAAYLIHTVRGDPELKRRVVTCFSADQFRHFAGGPPHEAADCRPYVLDV
jgi:hypothetical protein